MRLGPLPQRRHLHRQCRLLFLRLRKRLYGPDVRRWCVPSRCGSGGVSFQAAAAHSLLVSADVDECASEPCQNNGTCVHGFDSTAGLYACYCQPGWSGVNCEEPFSTMPPL